jgi:prepilin-type N-terminal cleavage/methylation domain-containing protein
MKENGFTLVELIVVIAIISILLALATLDFNALSRKHNMEAQVKQMYTDMLSAKVDAMHKRRQFTVNTNVITNRYTITDVTTGTVVQKTLKFPVTTTDGNNLTLTFDLKGLKTAPNTTQTICLQDNDSALAYDSIIIDEVKVNLAKRNTGGACAPANCTIK